MKAGYEVFEILGYISAIATCIPAVVTLFRGKKFLQQLLPVLIYAWLAALFEIAGFILSELSINNLVLIHIFTIIEFASLTYLYFFLFTNRYIQIGIPVLSVAFALFAICYLVIYEAAYEMNPIPRSIEAIVLIVFSIGFFVKLLRDLQVDNLLRNTVFWINTGILIYFAGNFFLFIFSNYVLSQPMEHFYEFWAMHSCLNIIFNGFLAYGLWQSSRRT
ncbi:MAG: hypothetical protein ACHQF2_03420 [Flavobacteriales bacterium]